MRKCAASTEIYCAAVVNLITGVFLNQGRLLKAGSLRKEFIYTILERDLQLWGCLLHSVPDDGSFQALSQKGSCVYCFTEKEKTQISQYTI